MKCYYNWDLDLRLLDPSTIQVIKRDLMYYIDLHPQFETDLFDADWVFSYNWTYMGNPLKSKIMHLIGTDFKFNNHTMINLSGSQTLRSRWRAWNFINDKITILHVHPSSLAVYIT